MSAKKTAAKKKPSKRTTSKKKASSKKKAPAKRVGKKKAAAKKRQPQSAAAKLASSLHLPRNAMIGGRAVPAASGKTFTTINPATGEPLAEVADCGAEDVDRAVEAARRAFIGPVSYTHLTLPTNREV